MSDDKGKRLLEAAYRLATPQDNLAYYRDVAGRYDSEFAEALGYSYPAKVAAIYQGLAKPDDAPVADIGCGTGLVGVALGAVVDGMDISPDMLAVATRRGVYRALYDVDLTGDLSDLPNGYGAVVSAGTFTHGHLGPEVLTALLGLARPGGLFVIGVNAAHYAEWGFEATLQGLANDGRIGPVAATQVPIYAKSGHDHEGDRALVLNWRRL